MSIQHNQNFNSERMKTRTLDSLEKTIARYENAANNAPSSAYDSGFWTQLQQRLQTYTSKHRKLAVAGQYTDLAAYLRDLEQYGIPLAVGRAQNRVENDDPFIIATTEFWDDFRADIREFETNTP